MFPRPVRILLGLLALLTSIVALWAYHAFTLPLHQRNLEEKRQITKHFLLTDYCFTTESRHTRHFSLPEWIAPFQDLPAYHEHFPSSSFFQPIPQDCFEK